MPTPERYLQDLVDEDYFVAKVCAGIALVFFLFSWLGGTDLDPARVGLVGAGIFGFVGFLYACQATRFKHQLHQLKDKNRQDSRA